MERKGKKENAVLPYCHHAIFIRLAIMALAPLTTGPLMLPSSCPRLVPSDDDDDARPLPSSCPLSLYGVSPFCLR